LAFKIVRAQREAIMRILIATDAWHPQINGVVRSLTQTARAGTKLGADFSFLTPDRFLSVPLPMYPDVPIVLATTSGVGSAIEEYEPDAIHIATEGALGWLVRWWCISNHRQFTTSFTTKFPEYLEVRLPIPKDWSYAALRYFHRAATVTMVSTPRLMDELTQRGFTKLGFWTRGVDTEIFKPERAIDLNLPRPIFMSAGRLAPEKNLKAFLSLDLPGTKVVIGKGPQEAELRRSFPDVHFLGSMHEERLAAHIAAADVFVFPSKTDTYGVVQLEALACGVPVAAYPVPGPLDVLGDSPVGVLDNDLRVACLAALSISREECRKFALARSWEVCAHEFIGHVSRARRQ
jgi:glycosyltransferase involved in cell wall biosynthesis